MDKLMMINASPRAPRSNSKKYAEIFEKYSPLHTDYFEIKKSNHLELCHMMGDYSNIVFIFPLYVDCLPVTLLNFLKTLEKNLPDHKPVVSVIINCGFIEPQQNNIAVEILQFYCIEKGFPFGSVLKIGSGEAILGTPFQFFLKMKMKKFAVSLPGGKYKNIQVTMPISKKMFLKGSTAYWEEYGKKNGISKEEMSTLKIE